MRGGGLTRRDLARLLGGSAVAASGPVRLLAQAAGAAIRSAPAYALRPDEETFLDEMERAACLYFAEQQGPGTGQVQDRAVNRTATGELDPRKLASIAATGFGLTAMCIADRRGYLAKDRIRKQVVTTLEFHLRKLPQEHGFFYHFNDIHTGEPAKGSEVSSIDTAILLCGVLTARAYFNDARISQLATAIYERVDWPWMLNGGPTFAMGWNNGGKGFISSRWSHYCELMMIYLLAIGSPTHPVDPATWRAWTRPRVRFGGYDYISGDDPLFVHQYSQAWFDFRGKRDPFANYFDNSVTATRAHKAWCLSLKQRWYTEDYWGVSASDWQHGYTAWGGPPLQGPVDGSVVPCATAGSLAFVPGDCLRVQQSLRARYPEALGRYGLCDAFHPSAPWYDPDVLGIDLGIGLVMAENLRSGLVWQTFMRNPEAMRAMDRCGFRSA